jgi:hypothetical protein
METKEKGDERNNPRNNNDGNFSLSSGANNCKGKRGERKRSPMRMSCEKCATACATMQSCGLIITPICISCSSYACPPQEIHPPPKQTEKKREIDGGI